jgi:glucokinase
VTGPTAAFGAVDIGGTKIAVALISGGGSILAKTEFPTQPLSGPKHALARIQRALDGLRRDVRHELEGIGIGCTGPVDPITGIVGDVYLLPGWNGYPLCAALRQRCSVPVCLENDCDTAALAESRWGSGAGLERFLFVSMSTGIGAGLVLDGELYRGARGAHAEVGHMAIDPAGPLCYCGATGCWESLISGTALEVWYRDQQGLPEAVPAAQLFALAQQGDPHATAAIDRFRRYLAIGLGNLITLFAPDRIALGGGVMQSGHVFLKEAGDDARARAKLIPPGLVSIVPATFGADASLLGAAAAISLHRSSGKGSPCSSARP